MSLEKESQGFDNPALEVGDEARDHSINVPGEKHDSPERSKKTYGVNGGSISNVSSAQDKEPEDLRCGFGDCKPNWCQLFNNPRWILVWLSWFSFVQGKHVITIRSVGPLNM